MREKKSKETKLHGNVKNKSMTLNTTIVSLILKIEEQG